MWYNYVTGNYKNYDPCKPGSPSLCEAIQKSKYDPSNPCATSTINKEEKKRLSQTKGKKCKVCSNRGNNEEIPVTTNNIGGIERGSGIIPSTLLKSIRASLAEYMIYKGVSLEPYGFFTLIKDIFQNIFVTFLSSIGFAHSCKEIVFSFIKTIFWLFLCVFRYALDTCLYASEEPNRIIYFLKFAGLIIVLCTCTLLLWTVFRIFLTMTLGLLLFLIRLVW